MSRAVLLNIPAYDHILPTLSIAAELVQRGESLVYYATWPFEAAISATGATFRPYADLLDDLLDENSPLRLSVRIAAACRALLPGLLAEIRAEQVDYIIYDSSCAWGWYAAQILHRPAISSMTRLMLDSTVLIRSGKLFPTLQETLESLPVITEYRNTVLELERTYGIAGPGITEILNQAGALTLCYTSQQFQPYAESLGSSFKFVGPTHLPTRLPAPGPTSDLPLVVCADACDDADYLAALASDRWQVAAVNHTELADVIPHAAVCVTAGTMSSVQAALYYSVPLIVIPQTIEQSLIGQQVASLGAGVQIDELTPAHLRSAVEIVLANPHFRVSAAAIGESLRAAGGAARAADEILAFAAAFRQA